MTPFLADTNVVSELAKRQPDTAVLRFFATYPDTWISCVSFLEFAYGIECSSDPNRKARLERWVASVSEHFTGRIVSIDPAVAELAGRFRGLARRQGAIADPLDALIAASAAVHNLAVATRNTKHFEPFGVPLLNPWSS